MDLKRIQHALTLAQEMNFIRAAEKVHLSQPAFSRSIQTLEEQLGVSLFDRGSRHLVVTAVGREFLERARRVLHEAQSLERDMTLTRQGKLGKLAFGVGPAAGASLVPPLLKRLRQGRPELAVAIQVDSSQHLLNKLRCEEIEFFFGEIRVAAFDSNLAIESLTRAYGPFVCRPEHPLLNQKVVTPAELLSCGFAAPHLPQSSYDQLRSALGLLPSEKLPIAIECDNIGILVRAVRQENLVMIMAHSAVAIEIEEGTLCPLLIANAPPLFSEIGLVTLAGRSLSPVARLAIDTLRQLLADPDPQSVGRAGSLSL